MVLLGLLHAVVRVTSRVLVAHVAGPVALHLRLACGNLMLAGAAGVLIAIDKVADVLPGNALSNVYAHAHLAAVGWASMMVVGVGYRLLPMVLPSAMPHGRLLYASAVLLEIGLAGLVVTLVTGWPGLPFFACTVAAGLAVFLSRVVWMTTHRRTPAAGVARPDVGALQAGHALLYLLLTTGCGLILATSGASAWTSRLMMFYGVFGLLGFLGQLVVAMELRVLPLLAWYAAFTRGGFTPPAMSTHALPAPRVAAVACGGWVVGLPILAAGLALDRVPWVGAGAWVLLVAAGLNTAHAVWMLRPVWGSRVTPDR